MTGLEESWGWGWGQCHMSHTCQKTSACGRRTHLDPFTGAGAEEQGGLWEIFLFFLLAGFIWSYWDEIQKVNLGLTSAPMASLNQHCVPRLASFSNTFLVPETNKKLGLELPLILETPPSPRLLFQISHSRQHLPICERLERKALHLGSLIRGLQKE